MQIRKTTIDDINLVSDIYEKARQFMRSSGNMEQWLNGYPKKELIISDIQAGNSYVCINEDELIIGVFSYIPGIDPTYVKIYDGSWLNDSDYGVIHRIAVSEHNKGVAAFCYRWCLEQCPNIKIDTHKDNIPMQKSLFKNGFEYCGIIYLENGDERLAYQKTITK